MQMHQVDPSNRQMDFRGGGFRPWLACFALMAVVMMLGLTRNVDADETPMQKEYLKKLEGPILLRGDYFKAVLSAYSDFEHELSKNASAATAPDNPNPSLSSWLSKIEDYDIHVSQSSGRIIVQFNSTVRGKFTPVLGGGARYEIDPSSFAVLSKSFSK